MVLMSVKVTWLPDLRKVRIAGRWPALVGIRSEAMFGIVVGVCMLGFVVKGGKRFDDVELCFSFLKVRCLWKRDTWFLMACLYIGGEGDISRVIEWAFVVSERVSARG